MGLIFLDIGWVQSESHPKKTVAFDVDQVQKLENDSVTLKKAKEEEEEEKQSASAKIKKAKKKSEDTSSSVTTKLKKKHVVTEVSKKDLWFS